MLLWSKVEERFLEKGFGSGLDWTRQDSKAKNLAKLGTPVGFVQECFMKAKTFLQCCFF